MILSGQIITAEREIKPYLGFGSFSVRLYKSTHKHTRVSALPPCLCDIGRNATR